MKTKHIALIVLIFFLLDFSFHLIRLCDDEKIGDKIRNDSRIPYMYIKIDEVRTMAGISDILMHDPRYGFTFFMREFNVYRDNPDITPLEDNRRIWGYVDMNLRVWVICEFHGNEAYL